MTNEEAVKMLRTMQRTVYLGNRKFEDAIECAIKALSEPLQPREVLVAQAVLPQPAEPKRETATVSVGVSKGGITMWYECDACGEPVDQGDTFCSGCGRKLIHE